MTATTAERKKETMNCKSRGRQKIEIKRIDKESSRQTTFSKRRGGLFNKASELCLLCGAEAAILVFSPSGNRVYSFSTSPSSVDSILQRFIRGGGGGGGVVPDEPADADHHEAAAEEEEACRVGELKRQYLELLNQLEAEKKKRSGSHLGGHDQEEEEGAAWWWEAPIDDGMGLIELGQLKMRLEDLQNRVANRAHQLAAAHNGGHHGDDHDDGSAGFSFS